MMSALSIFHRLNPVRPRPVDWSEAQDPELALTARDHDRQGKEAFVEIEDRNRSITATTAGLSWQSVDATRTWIQSLPAADRPAALIGWRNAGTALSSENRAALEAVTK
jgi:hypothetical protein